MKQPFHLISVVAVMALIFVACNGDEPSDPEAPPALSVTGTDTLMFEPNEFTVSAGETITVELSAEETVSHTFTIEGAAEVGDLTVAEASPGETDTGTFTIADADTFEVFCSIPGHREAGMVATLNVVENG